jgi:phosphotransferase system enzyme I (PtsI)
MKRLTGIGVSGGTAYGRAVILIQRAHVVRYHVAEGRVAREVDRLNRSGVRSREQLLDIRARLAHGRGAELASLFDAQILMLDDPMLLPRAAELVRMRRANAEWAVQEAFDELTSVFDAASDPYLRERKGDVADLVGRLKMNLREGVKTPRDWLRDIDDASVLVADELTPSLAAQLDWTKVRGFAADAGSRTYHTAILARSLEVPAVVGLHDASRLIQPGQLVMIDAAANEVVIDPDDEMLARVAERATDHRPSAAMRREHARLAATADGTPIRLEANIEFPDDLAAARYEGAEGIGLYRSEFLLAEGGAAIDENHQYEIYKGMLEGMAPGEVTVRTFDVDEDRLASRSVSADTAGTWAADEQRSRRHGLRGLRLSLARPELFYGQVRALLRAARHGRLRIVFPFVSDVEQVREARRIVAEAAEELRGAGEQVPAVPVGVMIEIPAAAHTADLLAREVDFFTIGTNDLIQYSLAVDRADERVSRFYKPLHPSVLRMIVMVRRAAARQRIPVSLCGEMASDPALLALLVGLGLTSFSMTPSAMGIAKDALAEVRVGELRALAKRVLRLSTAEEIESELVAGLGRLSVARE